MRGISPAQVPGGCAVVHLLCAVPPLQLAVGDTDGKWCLPSQPQPGRAGGHLICGSLDPESRGFLGWRVWAIFPLEKSYGKTRQHIKKQRNITLPKKVHLVKAIVFPVVMYGCESWTIRKAEC